MAAKFDLTLGFRQDRGAGGISGLRVEYAEDLFDQATVADLAGRLTRLLAQAVAGPARPVSDLDVLDRRRAAETGGMERHRQGQSPTSPCSELFEAAGHPGRRTRPPWSPAARSRLTYG